MKQITVLIILILLSFNTYAQTYQEQFDKCSISLKGLTTVDSTYLARVHERDSCLVGSIAPEFHVTTMDGQRIDFSDLKGKVVVLSFWFTRCQPCIEEIPGLNKLVDTFSKSGVSFISITYDETKVVQQFLQNHTFKFQNVADDDSVRRDDFKLLGAWPYNIIIDRKGRISYMQFGSWGQNTFDFYSDKIRKLL